MVFAFSRKKGQMIGASLIIFNQEVNTGVSIIVFKSLLCPFMPIYTHTQSQNFQTKGSPACGHWAEMCQTSCILNKNLFGVDTALIPGCWDAPKCFSNKESTWTSVLNAVIQSSCLCTDVSDSFECFYHSFFSFFLQIYIIALRGVCARVCEGDYGVMTSAGVRAEPKKPFRHSNPNNGPSQTHTHTCQLSLA